MSLDASLNAFRLFVRAVLPTTEVIFADQPTTAPEPSGTYISLTTINDFMIGKPEISTLASGVNKELQIKQDWETVVRLTFIGPNAGNLAMQFNGALETPKYQDSFYAQGLVFRRRSPVQRVFQQRETKYVQRYILSVTFGYAVITKQPIDVITSIGMNNFTIP